MLKDRVAESPFDFENVMQADFVLHLYSLMSNHPPMSAWNARILGHADEQLLTGFDLFVSARAGKINDGLIRLFDVADWTQLDAKLGQIRQSSSIASKHIDYSGFIAANNSIFDH